MIHDADPEVVQRLAQFASIAEGMRRGVVITDHTGTITWANESFLRIAEFSLSEAVGLRPGSMLQGADTAPETIAVMRAAIARGEVQLIGASGTVTT